MVEFKGTAAHAAVGSLERAQRGSTRVELFTHARQPDARARAAHGAHALHDRGGGDVPNVVPEHGNVWIWARDFERDGARRLLERMRKIAEGAALVTGDEVKRASRAAARDS